MRTQIEKLKDKDSVLEKRHKDALIKHYTDNKVKNSVKSRLIFWEDEKYGWSHNPSNEVRVALHEQLWLSYEFPKDFPSY